MKRILQLLMVFILLSCSMQERSCENPFELIAHAGGAVDSCIYTNSREALEHSFEKGYKYIEFDLLFTSDSVLVAAHSWDNFNKMTGFAHWGDSVPTYDDFIKRKIYGRYTPVCAAEINAFFESHDSLFLVTDKISNPEILQRNFPRLKERMVVEAFSFQDYSVLKNNGYFRVLYSCMAQDLNTTLFGGSNQYIESIDWIALHTTAFNNPMFKSIKDIKRFNIALFTVDDTSHIPAEYRDVVKMVYTNYIEP